MYAFIRYLTFFGNLFPQFLICVLLLFIDFEAGYKVGSIWFWGYAINFCIKNTVKRKRPDESLWRIIKVNGYSFPSGHSVMSLILYPSIVFHFGITSPWSYAFYAMPLALGLTRLYLRVHYVSDVLAGWIIGILYLYFLSPWVVKLNAIFYPIFYQLTHWW